MLDFFYDDKYITKFNSCQEGDLSYFYTLKR